MMFCADYVAAFFMHGAFALLYPGDVRGIVGIENESASRFAPFVGGAAAGFVAASVVFPFDFVREALLPRNMTLRMRYLSSLSTFPYAATLFGVYFSCRRDGDVASQIAWSGVSAVAAMFAEMPFDHAKRVMFKSRSFHMGANLMYTPFAAVMLVMYDNAICKNIKRRQKK